MSFQFANTIQAHIVKLENGEVFHLALKRKDDDSWYPSIWQTVTGTTEENELPKFTAYREIAEETGLKDYSLWSVPYVTTFYDHRKNIVNFVPVFGTIITDGQQIVLSNEHSDFKWLKINELEDLLSLPTHYEAAKIFEKYVVMNPTNLKYFKIDV